MNKFTIYNLKFLIFFSFFLLASQASAATLSLDLEKKEAKIGEIVNLTIFLNTEGQSINTIEGDLRYDASLLQAEAVNIGGSFISFWIEQPDLKTPGTIHFSGITPGGISATSGEAFGIIFRAQKEGNTILSLNNVNLFLNDGEGSRAQAKIMNASFKISGNVVGTPESVAIIDTVPPEKFKIVRARDVSIYDNKWFAAFSTLDKISGVDRYIICEFWSCTLEESPYLLKNQTSFYRIKVNAYDQNGNSTSATLTSPYLVLIILLLFTFIVVTMYLCIRLRKNSARK
ncbi:hypothetical protein A2917_01640 [Candidatus Nomurabacteria bacterium RIFCSPLOWO2_01_FULL_42_17]|uniref:Cohesin domain-containing protein n=1 Tax=Candidatus Nomurabacteria bacterium RIFCSPLOWO2_01_FULL_42_17 TaxID=1801780 RepID=A0A1F6XLT9_9BACT|nr:MAG: hypothetical protein A2917_01640 [Candidatus Nomurabacteria bacterium RIFCSPLOWO2_01_FULL_42_17]